MSLAVVRHRNSIAYVTEKTARQEWPSATNAAPTAFSLLNGDVALVDASAPL
jgi:hypothetical protein